ncbi:MAG: hypothetical protein GTO03_13260, partial [Planctomycetales bacterium]|nr:hypothetical protein [Planctomycetales bacterium]
MVVRLRGARVDDNLLDYVIEYGLDRVAKLSHHEQDFRDKLVALMKSFRHLVLCPLDPACQKK